MASRRQHKVHTYKLGYNQQKYICNEILGQLEDFEFDDDNQHTKFIFELCAGIHLMSKFLSHNGLMDAARSFIKTNYLDLAEVFDEEYRSLSDKHPIPISVGDLVDRATILKIKLEHIKDEKKLNHIQFEFNYLTRKLMPYGYSEQNEDYQKLYHLNTALWIIEDSIRKCEREGNFDETFISLARSIYKTNDKRYAIKQKINKETCSTIIEEKEYVVYDKEN